MSDNCLFCKIAKGEIPSKKAYEDDDFFAFHDINHAAPVQLLLIPKRHIVSMQDVQPQDAPWLGRMMTLAPRLAQENGCKRGPDGGLRLVVNKGIEEGQEIAHLPFHINEGRPEERRVGEEGVGRG